ncbi:hypothetical protein PPERSA_00494 [Pseudocohnilembus persalinus]|uniref:Intraflagellar transport protein 46 homolog n=1 Tax=Pseudocohnilembus persalinus TaxID=266149 RepID=A0A0V0QIN4_PSEPJ|nr:hypothetical protein PPERSA_00494 [Pseudocohnilembus persalinus]|eukprot:KRX01872.1 hypothetical protein PPERSA_00494 [Pseudocohnilembus persalinus]
MSEQGEQPIPGASNHQRINNHLYDEAVEFDSQNGSEIQSSEEDRADQLRQQRQEEQRQEGDDVARAEEGQQQMSQDQEDSQYEEKNQVYPGAYNPSDYDNLQVNGEIKELFKYITRYKPVTVDIDAKLKPFIPDYFPAIGEVDAFLKMDKYDGTEENLGISILDEPNLNMSKQAAMEVKLRDLVGGGGSDKSKPITVYSIENADKNPKAIQSWINDVQKLRENKPQPSVSYTKQMPEIDALMQVWPQEIEEVFNTIELPNEDLDVTTEEFARLLCGVLDIPIHPQNGEKNVIEALHVAFTLYTELKANQHIQQNQDM